MKTPIREEIGSYKSTSYLKKLIPKGSVVNSYLFLSGGLEFSLCQSERFVCAHTNKYAVYEFWKCMMEDSYRIYKIISSDKFSFSDEKMLYLLQENWMRYADAFLRSAIFYYLNRCSSTGSVSSGALEIVELNSFLLLQVKNFEIENFHVNYQQVEDWNIFNALCADNDCDYRLIPAGRFNYNLFDAGKSRGFETTTINHRELEAQFKKNADKKIILVYKFHPELLNLYKENIITMIDKYGKLTNNQKNCEEIVVTNF